MCSMNRRIEIVLKNPNPLFEKWLQKWLEEATAKGSRSKFKIKDALDSLRQFPLPLETGRDCAILRGFGPTLCKLIDKELELYKKHHVQEYREITNYRKDVQCLAEKASKLKKIKSSASVRSQTTIKVSKTKAKEKPNETQIHFSPGDFEVVLLIDTQETSGKFKKLLNDFCSFFDSEKIVYEVRRLSIGDFVWICRDSQKNELVLPYIVERKRMDDLASSIRDGRFHEQKFRLRESGIRNLIYLIENYGNNTHVGLPMNTLMQSAVNTQVHGGFKLKFTDSHKDSLLYLSVLTKILIENYKNKTIFGVAKESIQGHNLDDSIIGLFTFDEFQKNSMKNKSATVKDIFIKQILQLRSLSVDKALAILNAYPTPRALLLAYKNCPSEEEAEMLLANLSSGKLKRPVGSAISKTIYTFYRTNFQ